MTFEPRITELPARLKRWIEAQVPQKVCRDFLNRVRFRDGTFPLSDMTIYPVPRSILYEWSPRPGDPRLRRQQSGRVVAGGWDLHRCGIEENRKLVSCRMRWEGGALWEDTPQYRKMLDEIAVGKVPDGCRTPEDVAARYATLDRIFDETRKRGRLLSMSELPEGYRREHGATLVHVGRDGTLLRSGGGAHRFAIGWILDLPEMPAQLGAVHPEALKRDLLSGLVVSRLAPPP